MTLNSASKKSDIVDYINVLGELINEDLLKDVPASKIDDTFDKGVKEYCKTNQPEYYAMLMNNSMTTTQAYDKLFPNKKAKEESESTNSHKHDLSADGLLYCPCCSQKVKKDNKELDFITKWSNAITTYVANLKFPTNV